MTSGTPAGGGMRWGDAPREPGPPQPGPGGPPPGGSGWAPPQQPAPGPYGLGGYGPGGYGPGGYGPGGPYGPGPGGPGAPPPGWAPPRPPDPARRRRVRRIVLGVVVAVLLVVLLVVLLLGLAVGPRFLRYDVLDAAAVQQGVTRVVTDDWRRPIADVRCPTGQRTRPGVAFTCGAVVDGRPQQVPVTVTDEAGTYEVGQPR